MQYEMPTLAHGNHSGFTAAGVSKGNFIDDLEIVLQNDLE